MGISGLPVTGSQWLWGLVIGVLTVMVFKGWRVFEAWPLVMIRWRASKEYDKRDKVMLMSVGQKTLDSPVPHTWVWILFWVFRMIISGLSNVLVKAVTFKQQEQARILSVLDNSCCEIDVGLACGGMWKIKAHIFVLNFQGTVRPFYKHLCYKQVLCVSTEFLWSFLVESFTHKIGNP